MKYIIFPMGTSTQVERFKSRGTPTESEKDFQLRRLQRKSYDLSQRELQRKSEAKSSPNIVSTSTLNMWTRWTLAV